MARLIFHVDVNSAFLSWEATRRVKAGEADLRLIPSCIAGDPAKRTSIVLAKSIPAKKLGIKTGEPISMALRKCRELVIAPPDFRLYEQSSNAFLEICREYTPRVEKFSIDECFLDMSNTQLLFPDPVATATELKNAIRDRLGFTVNIGVGPNKLLAKTAGDFEKPDRVHTLFSEEIPEKYWVLPVEDMLGVGRGTVDKLRRCGIATVGALAQYDLRALQSLVGQKFGQQLHDYANGIDDSPVREESPDAKGYSISTTLEQDLQDRAAAHRILLALTDHVALRMRRDGARAGCVSVTVRTNDFKDKSHQRHLAESSDVTAELFRVVRELFEELWDHHTPLRLLGVALTQVDREGAEQISLFPDRRKEKQKKIDAAMDRLRSRYGMDAVTRASVCDTPERLGRKTRAQWESSQKKAKKSGDEK